MIWGVYGLLVIGLFLYFLAKDGARRFTLLTN